MEPPHPAETVEVLAAEYDVTDVVVLAGSHHEQLRPRRFAPQLQFLSLLEPAARGVLDLLSTAQMGPGC
ncbi:MULTISPECIES: hypothetical protein [unclassified Mycolicibacterium]|uniref:hypothetical protein n=1 Tax=unclassified Mycolicibacterium TaxID=2636767 RepID=UPI001F4C2F90|nr:hypothetical protein [Mycolicibacterium sp. YH-1]UNB51458.1 hypothetical protein L0M16_26610 [Mycolicibacterium sp. YH-1]